MNDIAIKASHVSKSFKLPREKNTSVKSALINFRPKKMSYELQQALKDVSFEVKKGEFFGIVGRNGSGKSTLLKVLAGIYTPTSGEVQVNGSLTPFIELGVGFNPELTGRENVYLNGALLGFSRKEMRAMYKDIVDFAELEKFMDQKLKNYSSGMQVRLAFSIAIKAESQILILDEVLAVGDEAFQRKCISVFEQYKALKKTIVLVTHDMSVVERFCTRAMLIKDSRVVKIGDPAVISSMYRELNKDSYDESKIRLEEGQRNDFQAKLLDAKTRKPKKRFAYGETALVQLSWKDGVVKHAGVAILKQSGEYLFGPNTYLDKQPLKNGAREIYYSVKLSLAEGEYYLKAGIFGETDKDVIDFIDNGPSFSIEAAKGATAWGGLTYLPHQWGDGKAVTKL